LLLSKPSSCRSKPSSFGANLLLIGGRRTATALRSVEHDGDACTLELVAQLRVATLRHELAGHSLEFERDSISVELLCIEQRGTGEERRADGGGGTGGVVVGHREPPFAGPEWAALTNGGRPRRSRKEPVTAD